MIRTLAHVSDLHVGRARGQAALEDLVAALERDEVDTVVVSGDVTHRGRRDELRAFERLFAGLRAGGRLVVVPGNHDRLGDDVSARLQDERVIVDARPGLHLVRFDSTGPHNRNLLCGHGLVTDDDLQALESAFASPAPGSLRVLVLHHHLLPLPEEGLHERVVSWLGLPHAAELRAGWQLADRLRSRCDLVLHGHRHVPASTSLFPGDRWPLVLFNAGSTPELGRYRAVRHQGGRILSAARWYAATQLSQRRHACVIAGR
jgi:3',5'-cyclic AMP phosphodiesterase CpdA